MKEDNSKISWMVKNSVAANLLMMLFVVGGIAAGFFVKQEIFPEFSLDTVTVSVSYPGASPEEVERGIVLAVENAVQGLENVEEVRATASEGSASVIVEMVEGGDLQRLANDVKNAVDSITSFPEDSEYPKIAVASRKRSVIEFCIYGDISEKAMYELSEIIRDELIQLDKVTSVDINGTRTPEINIEVPMENLRRYGLTLTSLAEKVKNANLELPGGGLKTSNNEILLRVNERRDYGSEFEKLPVIYSGTGTPLTLDDIGTVVDAFEDVDTLSLWNGKRAAFFRVYAMDDQTPIEVADAVLEFIENYKDKLPEAIKMDVSYNMTDTYKQRIDLLLKNGIMGWLLVVLLLAMFLDYRLAFWVSMGIPISILGTILLAPMLGATINMVTLFAFIISLGILVDDAVIIGENVYSHRQRGMSWQKSAIEGAKEVCVPVIFSILTNIAAFMPLFFIPGIMGKIYFQIPIIVITAFSISLIESLFILPAHLAHIKDKKKNVVTQFIHSHQQAFSFWFQRSVEHKCGSFIEKFVIRYRYIVIAIGIAILCISLALPMSRRVGMEFSPKVEADFSRVALYMPFGTSFEKTKEYAFDILKKAEELVAENGGDKLSTGTLCLIGQSIGGSSIGGHFAEVRIYLTTPDLRPMSTDEFTNLWRSKVGNLVGIENITFESDSGGPGSGSAMSIELSHKDIDVLKAAGEDLAEAFAQYPGVKDINDGYSDGKVQFNYQVNDKGRLLGFTASEIATQLRASFYGSETRRQQRGRAEIKIMTRLPENERVNEETIDNFILISPTGQEVPLSEVADMQRGRSYTSIGRENSRRVINVLADISPRSKANEVLAAIESGPLPEILNKYPGLSYSYSGRQEEMSESLNALGIGFIMAFVAIYGLIAVPLKSYAQPLVIMFVIPFGAVGAILGHMLMGYSLSLMSMFGIIALAGVVVNDSLVLIELANRRRALGENAKKAVIYAASHRIRPVMLTTLTTFFGLAPMIFETSRQAKFLIPMAISLGYGILFATAITLLMVPSLYVIIEDIASLLGINSDKSDEELDV